MGGIASSIVGLVNSSNSLIQNRKINLERIGLENEARESRTLAQTGEPPFFFRTIAAREVGAPDGVYSVQGIRAQLQQNIIPPGYTLTSLRQVGFNSFVNRFLDREMEADENIVERLRDLLKTSIMLIKSDDGPGINNLTQSQQDVIDLLEDSFKEDITIDELNTILGVLPDL